MTDYSAIMLAQKFEDTEGRKLKAVAQIKANFPELSHSSHHCAGCFYYENDIICDTFLPENVGCGTTVVFVEDK